MKITCQLLWTDYLEAKRLHGRPGKIGKILDFIFLGLSVLYILSNLVLAFLGRSKFTYWIPILLLLSLFLIIRYLVQPYQAKHLFQQQKEFSFPIEHEITDTHLISTTQIGVVNRPLSHFVNWKENKELFVLYHTDYSFFMIPKRFFADMEQVDYFRSCLEKNIVPNTGKLQRVFSIVFFGILIIIMISVYIGYTK